MGLASAVAVALGLVVVALLATRGPLPVWRAFGPADQGPVAFETLERPSVPSHLVCPPNLCAHEPHEIAPTFACSAEALWDAAERTLRDRGAEITAADRSALTLRAVERTPLWRLPDTVNVRVVPQGTGSTIAILSRSLVGRSDLGTNRRRVRAILDALERACGSGPL